MEETGITTKEKCKVNTVYVKDYLTKSTLPASDYVINPYVGCPHACKYCYACFMKRFTGHSEPWGSFLDVKLCDKPVSLKRLAGKSVFLSSVTDCYNPFEEKYKLTRGILEQLAQADCEVGISTKSGLIARDLDLLVKFKNLKVSMSVNTLDERFKDDMDCADSIEKRLQTLEKLHQNGIFTILFMSPIFPEITDFRAIIERTRDYIDQYWFENLNLRGSYKSTILSYIDRKYPKYAALYREIYGKGDKTYWEYLSKEIEQYCTEKQVNYINYFYHEKIKKKP